MQLAVAAAPAGHQPGSVAVGINNIITGNGSSSRPDLFVHTGLLLSELLISEDDNPRFDAIVKDLMSIIQ